MTFYISITFKIFINLKSRWTRILSMFFANTVFYWIFKCTSTLATLLLSSIQSGLIETFCPLGYFELGDIETSCPPGTYFDMGPLKQFKLKNQTSKIVTIKDFELYVVFMYGFLCQTSNILNTYILQK